MVKYYNFKHFNVNSIAMLDELINHLLLLFR